MIFLGLLDVGISQELQDAIVAGKQEYMRSCALCHGDSGKGGGVYASKLIVKPANLTLLKKQNKGVFPTRAVFRTIEGSDNIKFHGPRSMPVWGDRFDHESLLYVDDRFTRTFVRGRIFELLLYLEEIQVQ
jgi:mono/diheme cytochrome c family protein